MKPLSDRFWEKVRRGDSCWEWVGATDRRGYGQIWDLTAGRHRTATRVAWELHYGEPPPASLGVLHTCDRPSCVRPNHLFLGTHTANMRDAARKGHLGKGHVFGDRHPNTKIPDSAIAEIRDRYAAGESRLALAEEFGVAFQTIWRIGTGRER